MKTFILLVLLIWTACLPALQFARWNTSMGDFTCELYDEIVPITAGNFVTLANSGFYNNLIFHRVVSGFVIQDGCPYGTGYGGPGYTIPDEFSPLLNHNQAGTLAMARTSAPNSAGSQYYITLAPTPHLNGNYAVFGQVIEGLDTVLEIGQVPTNTNGLPNTPVNIHSVSIVDLDINSITPSNTEVLSLEPGQQIMFIVEASSSDYSHSFQWLMGGEILEGQTDFILETTVAADAETPIVCRVSQGDFSYEIRWEFTLPVSNQEQHTPNPIHYLQVSPNPFSSALSVSFELTKAIPYTVRIFDLRGRLVHTENRSALSSGPQEWTWQTPPELGSGTYLLRIDAGLESFVGKITYIK